MSIRETLYGSYAKSHRALAAAYDHCANTTRNYNECKDCAKSETPDAPPYIDDCVAAIRRARCSAKFRGGVSNSDCNQIRKKCEFVEAGTPESNCVNLWDNRLPQTDSDGGDSVILELEAPASMDIYSGKLDYCWRENPKYRDCLKCAENRYFNDACKENKAKHLCAVHRGNKPQGEPKQSPFCTRIGDTCGRKALPFMGCLAVDDATDYPDPTNPIVLAKVNGNTDSPVNCHLNTPNYRECRECVQLNAATGCELQIGYSRCWLHYNQDKDPKRNPYCSSVVSECSRGPDGEPTPIVLPYPSAEGYCFENKYNLSSSNPKRAVYERLIDALPKNYPLGQNSDNYRSLPMTIPSGIPTPCVAPTDFPEMPPHFDPELEPYIGDPITWIDEQIKCCKCLLYGEAEGETVPCQECVLWTLWNRQHDDHDCDKCLDDVFNCGAGYKGLTGCAGNGPKAVPGVKKERTYCRQAKMPDTWEGGWPNPRFKRCWCNGTDYPFAQRDDKNRKRLESMCERLSLHNVRNLTDPTGGANYLFACGSERPWVQCNIDGGRCVKVKGQCEGCGNCFYRCHKMPKPCDWFSKADPRIEIYGPDDFRNDNPNAGNPTIVNANVRADVEFAQQSDEYDDSLNRDGIGASYYINMRSGTGGTVYFEDPDRYAYATGISDCAETTTNNRECLRCINNSPFTNLCDDARKKTRCWMKFRKRSGQTDRDNPYCAEVRDHCDRFFGNDPAMACYDQTSFDGSVVERSSNTTISSPSPETTETPQSESTPPPSPPSSSSGGGYGGY